MGAGIGDAPTPRRPDGQIKDMACRELLRKLESRTLIKLPPRQNYGPRRLPNIESVEVDLTDVPPIFLTKTTNK